MRMKKKLILGIAFAVCAMVLPLGNADRIKAQEAEVKIDSRNFPDPVFREYIKRCDLDENGSLSLEEIQKATELSIESFDLSKNVCSSMDITGIEKLSNLSSIRILSVKKITGTLKKNTKLKVVEISENTALTWKEYASMLPLDQLEMLMVSKDTKFTDVTFSKNTKLQCVSFETCRNLKKLDVKKLKNLEELTVCNARVKALDLRSNKKLSELYIRYGTACVVEDLTKSTSDDIAIAEGTGLCYQDAVLKCDVKLPKNNRITDIDYFVKNKSLDLSECKKLTQVNVNRFTTLKFKKSWYRSHGKEVDIYADGVKQKKKKCTVKTKKGYTFVKGSKADPEKYWHMPYDELKEWEQEQETHG